jgi:magnesium chelatase subunit I
MRWNELVFHEGNEELQRFIELGVLAATCGTPVHFHVEGVRGTGKTTLIRAARCRLPAIERVRGCLYNCEAAQPHCPQHSGQPFPETETVTMPFLEISHSAKLGTVAGSIDLDRLTATDGPAAALLPGTLPRAHRGVVFVDEINRLADTSPALADLLLDAMGTKPGRVQIEETGLPTQVIPVSASVWAASNPDEDPGPLQDIRRQLADRFDFVVRIGRPSRKEVVRAILGTGRNKAVPPASPPSRVRCLAGVKVHERVDEFLSETYIRFQLESIRSVQAARLGALLHAALLGKQLADFSDLAAVLPAAFRHRLPAAALQEMMETLSEAVVQSSRREMSSAVRPPLKNEGEYRHQMLWRGFLERWSAQRNNADKSSVEEPLSRHDTDTLSPAEKKTAARQHGDEETAILQKR